MSDNPNEKKLDSPLVVHKKDDASFQETANEITMSATHTDEETQDAPTLERHRFRKKKKKRKAPYIILALIAVAAAVICALIYSGVLPVDIGSTTTTTTTRKSYTTTPVNKFEGIITVKGTYIFFEGEEIDGIGELESDVKYLKSGTKFVVQDENANSDFLNYEVLEMLSRYNIDYEVKHIVSSGLMSKYETTTQQTTAASTTKRTSASTTAD